MNPKLYLHFKTILCLATVGFNFSPIQLQIPIDKPNLSKTALPKSITSLDPSNISFQEIASGLTEPVFITNAGDGSGRIFIVEQTGQIRILKNGNLLATPFLDIHTIIKTTGSEQGLLALAFHPSYGANGKFYVA